MHWRAAASDGLAALRTLLLNGGWDRYEQTHEVLPWALPKQASLAQHFGALTTFWSGLGMRFIMETREQDTNHFRLATFCAMSWQGKV
jgi:hypothetical protein